MSLVYILIVFGILLIITILFRFQQKTKEFLKIVNEVRIQHETQDLSFKTAVKFMMVRLSKVMITVSFDVFLCRLGNLTFVELLICTKIMK